MSGPRGREFVFDRSTRAMLVAGTLVPSLMGASIIGMMASRGLPTGAALSDPAALRVNIVASVASSSVSVPLASMWGLHSTTTHAGSSPAARHAVLMNIPTRPTAVSDGSVVDRGKQKPTLAGDDVGSLYAGRA